MKFIKVLLMTALVFTACKKEQSEVNDKVQIKAIDTSKLTKAELSKINFKDIGIDAKAKPIVANWQAYYTLVTGVENLKNTDFSFFDTDSDLFTTNIKELEATIPNNLASAPIMARLLVLKTMLFKFEELLSLQTASKKEKRTAIKQVFVALSNLNFQINKKIEKDNQVIIKPY